MRFRNRTFLSRGVIGCGVVLLLGVSALASPLTADAQVVEQREGRANPVEVMFRSALYGGGTGLLLGGAYLLVRDGDDPSDSEILRWSAAGGVFAGVAVGAIYVATRPSPGSMLTGRQAGSGFRTGVFLDLGLKVRPERDTTGRSRSVLGLPVVRVVF